MSNNKKQKGESFASQLSNAFKAVGDYIPSTKRDIARETEEKRKKKKTRGH